MFDTIYHFIILNISSKNLKSEDAHCMNISPFEMYMQIRMPKNYYKTSPCSFRSKIFDISAFVRLKLLRTQ